MNPNEPAFPEPAIQSQSGSIESASAYTGHSGLTVRAELAKAAMQGMLGNPNLLCGEQTLAEEAVKYADALLAELNKAVEEKYQP